MGRRPNGSRSLRMSASGICNFRQYRGGRFATGSLNTTLGIVSQADNVCRTDADCVYVPRVSCVGCGLGSVSTTGVAAIATGLAEVEQKFCKPFADEKCSAEWANINCPPKDPPLCVAGKCTPTAP